MAADELPVNFFAIKRYIDVLVLIMGCGVSTS